MLATYQGRERIISLLCTLIHAPNQLLVLQTNELHLCSDNSAELDEVKAMQPGECIE